MNAEVTALSIGPGSRVRMHYTITLADGTVADTSREGEPLEFVMGDGSLIEGLELALYGLKVGDKQVVTIEPREAFGYPDPDNVHTLPRSEFPADLSPQAGQIMAFTTPSGEEIPGAIVEVGENDVTVDFNHPLAGHEIVFDVEILAIAPGAVEADGES